MAKIQFVYYLHDDYGGYERGSYLRSQNPAFTEELIEKMGEPFYEIKLTCEVDTDTGDVTILSAE